MVRSWTTKRLVSRTAGGSALSASRTISPRATTKSSTCFCEDSSILLTLYSYILAQNYFPSGRRIRPYDTVKPLADDLGLKVDHHCERDDARCVRRAIRKASKKGARRILVCWEHRELSRIAKKLGIHGLGTYRGRHAQLAHCCTEYPDDRYDVIFDLYRGKVDDVSSEQCPGLDEKWAQ